jgi:aspartyl-tRNA(Asn)/glutamyl-tRNA(Gln) amidotransferase subunit B
MSENKLKTTIGLEIHVQLKTKSKMFCRCDNVAEGKKPNTVVCPICLGLPGALPVASHQAIEWTIKTGLAFDCTIPATAKFDRKHYFYPDLPKGYQISQYDEPFCVGGFLEVEGEKIRLNRIHLEEDAGKLNHVGNASLVDLNRAGTPLMEIVTEPDLTSPKQAGEFLRKLQKIVRDVVQVSEASMEKGHMRCDANISVSDENGFMSPIVELKNINSFKFVEKALALVDTQIRDEYETWPKKPSKETWGYDSVANKVYLQRRKEEAADYRYFPCPDLPPFHSDQFDLEKLKKETAENEETKVQKLIELGISEADAKVLAGDQNKVKFYESILSYLSENDEKIMAAKAVVHNYFGFVSDDLDLKLAGEYAKAVKSLAIGKIQKNVFTNIVTRIKKDKAEYAKIENEYVGGDEIDLEKIVDSTIATNLKEVARYQAGEKQLIGFFVGQIMKECRGKGNPQIINKLLREKLGE